MEDKKFFIWVKALITNSKGEILIMKKVPRKPTDKWVPFWDVPGGKIQDGGIKETLLRETEEELGVSDLKIGDLYDVTIANFDVHSKKEAFELFFVIYKCTIPKDTKLKLSEEHSEYRWVNSKKAKELLAFMLPKAFLEKVTHDFKTTR